MDDHPRPATSNDAVVSQRNIEALEDEKEEDEELANTSFRFAPSIATPIPDSHAVLDTIRQDDDKWEERDRMIKEEIANRLSREEESSDSRILNNNSTDDTGRDDGAFVGSASSGQSRHSVGNSNILSNVTEERPRQSQSTTSGPGGVSGYDVLDASVAFAGAQPASASEATRPLLQPTYDSNNPLEVPEAYLVKSTMRMRPTTLPALVSAEPLKPWHKRTWGRVMICIVTVLATLLIILTSVFVSIEKKRKVMGSPSQSPSFVPSLAPSFDASPTLEIVRSRGVVRCGHKTHESMMAFNFSEFAKDLCRAVASVVFGDPEKIESKTVANDDRFDLLNSRQIDLVITGDTHTLRREVSEVSTGSGFTFTLPYLYTGIVYLGKKELVQCAEDQIRFGNPCSRLKICVQELTPEFDDLKLIFPPSFLETVPSFNVLTEKFENKTCNVVAYDILVLLQHPPFRRSLRSGECILGNKTLDHESLSIATRNSDQQWSDIIDGAIQGLRQGDTTNITKDTSLCPVDSSNTQNISFMNAPVCVGNFGDIIKRNFQPVSSNQTSRSIRNDTASIVTPPFGPLECKECTHPSNASEKYANLKEIFAREKLRCGIVDDPQNEGLTKMNEIYCHAVAAAIFQGDTSLVNISHFDSFNKSLIPIGEFDVIAGGWRDFLDWSPELSGELVFSVPYYYANSGFGWNGTKIFSLVTQAGDTTFSSFVNAVVMATIYAVQHGISKETNSELMPYIEIFGVQFKWMLKDVISSSGSYDEIYYESHGQVGDRGQNQVVIGRIPSQVGRFLCEISGAADYFAICQ